MKNYMRMLMGIMAGIWLIGMGSISVSAETVSENQMLEEQQTQEMNMEAELSLSGYCGIESENDGKNVTYTISDSNNDGIYDLLEIKGNGGIQGRDFGLGSLLNKGPYPWQTGYSGEDENKVIRITKVIIEDGVTGIGFFVFSCSKYLTEIVIPDSVKNIEIYAFSCCISLKQITLPEGITSINDGVFSSCTSLTEIIIPKSVKSIERFAFSGCTSLTSIIFPPQVAFIEPSSVYEDGVFDRCTSLATIFIPNNCKNVEKIKIPNITSQIEYTIDNAGNADISNIKLGEGRTLVEIPDAIYDYPIASVDESFRSMVSEEGHTHKCNEAGICQICNKKKEQSEEGSTENDIPEGPDTWKSKTGVEGFVFRLYNVAMCREAEEAGLNDWNTRLNTKEETAAQVAQGFIFSDEFKNFNYNNVQYVKMLYRTMFGREADEGGLNGWVSDLENGMSREYVFHGFAESQEFTNLCGNFGVERGNVALNKYRDKNIGVTSFIARLYTRMLGRGFDEEGIEYWCEKYITGETDIETIASNGFLHSDELKNQNLSDKEFVTRMYETFLNREPDEEGLDYWLQKLKRGEETRDSLVYGFTRSKEFGDLKVTYHLP